MVMEKEIKLPFSSDEFLNAWQIWQDYRKEIKKPLKSKATIQKQLIFLSTYSEQEAIMTIHQSIHFNWMGLWNLTDSYKQIYLREHGEFTKQKHEPSGDNKNVLKQNVFNKYFTGQ